MPKKENKNYDTMRKRSAEKWKRCRRWMHDRSALQITNECWIYTADSSAKHYFYTTIYAAV